MLVTLVLVANSWLPLTASVDAALSVPGATLKMLTGPAAPPISVIELSRVPPNVLYSTALASGLPNAISCETLTASVGLMPAVTPVIVRVPPVPETLIVVPAVPAPTVMMPAPGAPPVCWTSPSVPLLMPMVRLLIDVVLPAMLVVLVATPVLVANNWLPLTASVDAPDTVPGRMPVRRRLPPVPVKSTSVPPVCAPTVIVPTPGAPPAWRTRPAVPLLRLVIEVVLPAMAVVLPAMLVVLVATFWLVVNSCPPSTASVEPAASTPGATLCTVTGPAAPPTSVTSLVGTPPLGVVGVPGFEYCTGAAPALAVIAAVTCETLTASVGAEPAATLVICRVAPGVPTETSPAEVCGAARPGAI